MNKTDFVYIYETKRGECMVKQFGTSLIFAAASACLFACSSESNSTGPTEESSSSAAQITSSDTVPNSSNDVVPNSSSSTVPSSSNDVSQSSSSAVIPGTSSAVIPGTDPGSSLSSSSAVLSSSSDAPSLVDTPADPTAFWSDEFQGDALDITKWSYEIGNSGWGNNEFQYYTDRTDNAFVKDGFLHIVAKKEDFETAKYTSARIITQDKFDFTYGTIKARIALPVGKGIWPAFWMLGANSETVGWPLCGEIDIIEAVNDESVVYGTHHWDHEGKHAQYGNSTKQHFDGHYELDITEFHDYKMTWDKSAISMYVDDFMYQKIDISDASGEMGTFHKAFYFILNVAVGGSWPGFDIDDAQFPNEMIVDYIRVYKN